MRAFARACNPRVLQCRSRRSESARKRHVECDRCPPHPLWVRGGLRDLPVTRSRRRFRRVGFAAHPSESGGSVDSASSARATESAWLATSVAAPWPSERSQTRLLRTVELMAPSRGPAAIRVPSRVIRPTALHAARGAVRRSPFTVRPTVRAPMQRRTRWSCNGRELARNGARRTIAICPAARNSEHDGCRAGRACWRRWHTARRKSACRLAQQARRPNRERHALTRSRRRGLIVPGRPGGGGGAVNADRLHRTWKEMRVRHCVGERGGTRPGARPGPFPPRIRGERAWHRLR